jgi:hypothetical protein
LSVKGDCLLMFPVANMVVEVEGMVKQSQQDELYVNHYPNLFGQQLENKYQAREEFHSHF